jgi:hypothetical protein
MIGVGAMLTIYCTTGIVLKKQRQNELGIPHRNFWGVSPLPPVLVVTGSVDNQSFIRRIFELQN